MAIDGPLVGFVALLAATVLVSMNVSGWRSTVATWDLPPTAQHMPRSPPTVGDNKFANEVQAAADLLRGDFSDILSSVVSKVGAVGKHSAVPIATAERELAQLVSQCNAVAHAAGEHERKERAAAHQLSPDNVMHGGPSDGKISFPISVASLFAVRRTRPREVELPRLRSGSDLFTTLATVRTSLDAALRSTDDLIDRGLTYATNTVDKLKYQLDNFEPVHHAFSRPQWNPVRVSDMPKHSAAHPQRFFMIGISSVARKQDYLMLTLTSFIGALDASEKQRIKIVVFNANAPPSAHADVAKAKRRFAAEVDSGLLLFVERPDGDQPHELMRNESALTLRWGDPVERVRWRSKQVLDVAYLMRFCYEHNFGFDYFLMMEDDIIASKNFPTKIREYADSMYARTDWTMLSFYNPWEDVHNNDVVPSFKYFGVIGQLFRMHDLPTIVEFLTKNFDQSPLDWLFVDFLKKFDGKLIQHSPSYFQHQGKVSSMPGKEQNGGSVDFEP